MAIRGYLPLAGDPHFLEAFGSLILENDNGRAALIQSTGGTGAVRLAFELVKVANPAARVHLGVPSWPNHAGIAHALGLELRTYQYLDRHASRVDFEAARANARSCAAGDVFILHGSGHNPTGLDLARAEIVRRVLDQVLHLSPRSGPGPRSSVEPAGDREGTGRRRLTRSGARTRGSAPGDRPDA
jgi:aspartate/tyrosine/aromatic aminotransferase